MAVCKLAQDILKSTFCGYSLKQIVELYLANAEDVTATTVGTPTGDDATGVEVKTITLAAQAKFYKIEPAKDSATFEDSLQVGDGGSKMWQHCDDCYHEDTDTNGIRILDTHLGSGSIAVACDVMNFSLTGCEIDKQYYEKAKKRFDLERSQTKLF